jgi:hypothetical protein
MLLMTSSDSAGHREPAAAGRRVPGYPNLRPQNWPPAPKGNTRAAKHGARSDRMVAPRAAELVDELFAAHQHLDRARDHALVTRYALALAHVERCHEWLANQKDSVFSDVKRGVFHGVFDRLERWERQCDRCEQRLGLDPSSATRLNVGKAQTFSLAKYWQEQDERERLAIEDGDGDGDDIAGHDVTPDA